MSKKSKYAGKGKKPDRSGLSPESETVDAIETTTQPGRKQPAGGTGRKAAPTTPATRLQSGAVHESAGMAQTAPLQATADAPGSVHTWIFWGLLMLLFLAPYFRGLFFAPDQEVALLIAGFLFLAASFWRWTRREHIFLQSPLDWAVLALPVAYLASSFQAANTGLAVDSVVETILYFLVFWLVSRLALNEMNAVTLMRVVWTTAAGVSLAGLATA
ncbi:MAG: hypothetical protein K6T80_06755, partial [Firmicutes bacterium]|nr:hypothetical protein [Bacillota bacterium]